MAVERQQAKGQKHQDRRPDRKLQPKVRLIIKFDQHNRWDHNVADQKDGQVRRRIVSPVMVQFLTAMGAVAVILNFMFFLEVGFFGSFFSSNPLYKS